MKNKIIKMVMSFVLLFLMALSFGTLTKAFQPNFKENYSPELIEMRAVWVSTISNIDIKKQSGTSEEAIDAWKKQYIAILDNAQSKNLNTIIFQIRPNNDAFYPSKYNPWSEYLAGYGVDPGWDPVEWMIEVTHERGMEYHAWLNPYRTSASSDFDFKRYENKTSYIIDYDQDALDAYKTKFVDGLKSKAEKGGKTYDNPIFGENKMNDVVLGAEDKLVLNPASETVLKHLENTITEIVENYDIDGIHFDDYFYPNDTSYKGDLAEYKGYTFSIEPYREMKDYKKYLSLGGELSIYNWRRENVNGLIKSLSDIIRESNKTKDVKCAFGISPCAGYAPDESCGDRGVVGGLGNSCGMYSAYADLYADTRKWALEEWIDYITPQCYSNIDSNYLSYVKWWSETLKDSKTKLYIGQGLYKVEEWGDVLEMYYQVRYNQEQKFNVDGYFFFTYSDIVANEDGTATKNSAAMSTLSNGIWKRNTLTPIYDAYEYKDTVEGTIKVNSIIESATDSLIFTFDTLPDAKAYVLEEYENSISEIDFNDNKYVNIFYGKEGKGEFTPVEGKKYVLAPVAQNNVVQTNYVELDLNNVVVNNVPEVSIENIPNEVQKKSTLDVKINIVDTDNSEFTYVIYLSIDGGDFSELKKGSTSESSFTYTWNTYLIAQENIQFKVVVKDDKDSSEAYSNIFNVVDSVAIKHNINYELDGGSLKNPVSVYVEGTGLKILGTPTKEGYKFAGWMLNGEKITSISASQKGDVTLVATWEKVASKKGCSKNIAETMIATLSAVSLAILVFRKK